MAQLKKIEQDLNTLSNSDNVSLAEVMQLRNEAATHYKVFDDVLKNIKKQPVNEQ